MWGRIIPIHMRCTENPYCDSADGRSGARPPHSGGMLGWEQFRRTPGRLRATSPRNISNLCDAKPSGSHHAPRSVETMLGVSSRRVRRMFHASVALRPSGEAVPKMNGLSVESGPCPTRQQEWRSHVLPLTNIIVLCFCAAVSVCCVVACLHPEIVAEACCGSGAVTEVPTETQPRLCRILARCGPDPTRLLRCLANAWPELGKYCPGTDQVRTQEAPPPSKMWHPVSRCVLAPVSLFLFWVCLALATLGREYAPLVGVAYLGCVGYRRPEPGESRGTSE